ncbi:MAG: ABC transporter ATP-binding protein [Anaerolineae bacterium]|nr:ABC transporter ATP-binding protein [Anaerolineae bacterium]
MIGDQQVKALNNVTLSLAEGRFTAIMGPSGSGKSTLLHLIGGLDRPTTGEIVVNRQPLHLLDSQDLAQFRQQSIGFIFQTFHLIPTMTALENVVLPGVFKRIPSEIREERAQYLLHLLKMGNRLHHRPNQLSGGQQQRVAIARALFNNPPIILADEPTGALDSVTGQTVMRLLRNLTDQLGKSIIVVTHDLAISKYADQMVQLADGRIISIEDL